MGEIKDGKITIGSLSGGSHQLRLNSQSGERSIVFAVGGVPTINLAVTSNRNYGMLVVETGVDGAVVFVDGQRYPKLTERGQLRLPVEAKEHTVRVAKDAHRAETCRVSRRRDQGRSIAGALPAFPGAGSAVGNRGSPGSKR